LVAQSYARVQTTDVDPNFVKMWFECAATLKFFVRAASFLPLVLPGGYVDREVVDATATTASRRLERRGATGLALANRHRYIPADFP